MTTEAAADLTAVRRGSRLVETLHAVVYFAPEVQQAYREAGLTGFWRGYFAGRTAPLGTASPELATALLGGFAPAMVGRALPDVWGRLPPAGVLTARAAGVRASLARLLGDTDVTAAADATRRAAGELDLAGRPMAAAQAAQPRPDDPLLALWHDCTVLREHRGDGHLAVLTVAGLRWPEPHVLLAALGRVDPRQQEHRGWDDDAWSAARERLVRRGWLDEHGPTDAGRAASEQLETQTDRLTASAVADLVGPLTPLAARTSTALPYPNAMGLPQLG